MFAQIVLFDGFAPLDVIGPYDVLAAGRMFSAGDVEVELVSAEGPRQVVSGTPPLSLAATARLDAQRADLIVVPGAAGPLPTGADDPREDTILAIQARAIRTDLAALLADAMKRPETIVATVCGGSMLLAMAGLVGNRPVTTNDLALDALAATGTNAINARVVDDGDLITAAGVTSGVDLGLYVLERELGPRIAHAVEKLFAHERRGTVWRDSGRAPAIAG